MHAKQIQSLSKQVELPELPQDNSSSSQIGDMLEAN